MVFVDYLIFVCRITHEFRYLLLLSHHWLFASENILSFRDRFRFETIHPGDSTALMSRNKPNPQLSICDIRPARCAIISSINLVA